MAGVAPIVLQDTVWDWSRPYLLGVLNVTPDSFSDGGLYRDPERAVDRALELIAEGADAIDVGGESTRPGAEAVAEAEELRRVLPVIEGIRARSRVPISVDTSRAAVADAALRAGADVVNDVGLGDPPERLGAVAARAGAAYIAMHSRRARESVEARDATRYDDVVARVAASLAEFAERLVSAGVPRERVILDPGVGFAKSAADSMKLLANLDALRRLGHAVCVGPSRKSFISQSDAYGPSWSEAPAPPHDRVGGTAAAVALAVAQGAEIVRVHDVAVMRQAARVAQGIARARRAP
ncbi:MAG: dihydropteroate synthase [Polyangiales bacterium]